MTNKRGLGAMGITLIAAAIGVVGGILFAPKSGKETRKDLRKRISKLEKKTKEGLDVAKEAADESIRELKALTGEIKIDAKELSSDAKVRARRTMTHAKTGAQNVESKVRQSWVSRRGSKSSQGQPEKPGQPKT